MRISPGDAASALLGRTQPHLTSLISRKAGEQRSLSQSHVIGITGRKSIFSLFSGY